MVGYKQRMTTKRENLKRIACEAIDQAAADLKHVSQEIWDHPELKFEEFYATEVLTALLEKYKFPVERKFSLDTAFRSVYGQEKKPNVAIILEYDALPEIGHACGHNLIAEAGAGASIGVKAALDAASAAGESIGTLTVVGTPAEEGGCGKKILADAGAFDGVDAAMMVHPFPVNISKPIILGVDVVTIKYTGKASHAAGFPWEGVNALDAAVLAYNSISMMRQQLEPEWKIHGIITNGGAKPNIIPETSELYYYVRCQLTSDVAILMNKLFACTNAAAAATGCQVEYEWREHGTCPHLITNDPLSSLYEANATSCGVQFCEDPKILQQPLGSTDMGYISHVVPSIHPGFHIGTTHGIHTREFAKTAGSDVAQEYCLKQAKSLAMTAIDIYCQPQLTQSMWQQFEQDTST